MKKAANILFLIGGIFGIISIVICAVAGFGFLILASDRFTAFFVQMGEDAVASSPDTEISPAEIAASIQGMLQSYAVIVLLSLPFTIACTILAFKARNTNKKGIYIAALVLGILNSSWLIIIGGILALADKDETQNI